MNNSNDNDNDIVSSSPTTLLSCLLQRQSVVYVLYHSCTYYKKVLVGIYSTKETAKRYAEEYAKNDEVKHAIVYERHLDTKPDICAEDRDEPLYKIRNPNY